MRRGRAVLVLSVLLAGLTVAPPASAAAAPAPLPATRLEFGLSNLDVSWMTSSGVPWRYRYQYLAGGINTSGNWITWQDPSLPPGQFAVDFMNNSGSYIPVFTYYELLQSLPSVGGDEGTRDYNNLNNASTMNAYYVNFKLLMQKAGAYGKQVVVHVEPDFWGYMQHRAASAASITASVGSSGFAEAAAFPDTLVGFASALKYLRDTYAPNALLAMHASMWSSGLDIATNTRTDINAAAEADKTAAFLNSAGAGSWDAIFNDVDDHNAAWWELASCGTPPCVNQYFTHWWDPTNTKFPNFTRYLTWVADLHAQTSRPQVAWQVPMGNQYFLTMNNTCNHYQDNVAPYFIAHPNELFSAGLVAVLFGPGNSCQTGNEDSGDGVTNNGGAPTTDTLGGCSACNTHTSSYADDDGGYLRQFVRAYYQACSSATLEPVSPGPSAPGTPVALMATSTGCSTPEYRFFVQKPGGSWVAQTGYGAGSWTWNTSGLAPGVYGVGVWARNSGSPSSYEAYWLGTYTLSVATCTSASLATSTTSPQAAGLSIVYGATATGCPDAQYRFWLLRPGGAWTMQRDYGAAPSWTWNTNGLAPGTYQLGVWARQAGSRNAYDAYGFDTFVIGAGTCNAARMSPDVAPPQPLGTTVNFTATSNGCQGAQYEFWLLAPGGKWTVKRPYNTAATWAWNTAASAPGTYQVGVWVKAAGSARAYDAYYITTYQVVLPACTSAGISAAPASPQQDATPVTLTATSSGCVAPRYEFWILRPGTSTWSAVQPYGSASQFAWTSTSSPGTYRLGVWVRRAGSTASYESYAIVTFQVLG